MSFVQLPCIDASNIGITCLSLGEDPTFDAWNKLPSTAAVGRCGSCELTQPTRRPDGLNYRK